MNAASFDVVIAGGGPAGATLAAGLAAQGRCVAIIERTQRQVDTAPPSFDDRTLALNAASLNILKRLGLLDTSVEQVPIRHIRISRAGGFGRLNLDATEFGVERFGSVIVARELGRRLMSATENHPNITWLRPDGLKDFKVQTDHVRITTDHGDRLRAGLLVGADGSRSQVREQSGIATRTHDYHQQALVFNVMPERALPHTAWERFTPSGPLALLPQPGGRAGVVWIDSADAVEALAGLDDKALCRALQQRFGPALGQFSRPGRRSRYPLMLCVAGEHTAPRVALVGNSATTVHPVSAQGFNLGLRDIAGLLDVMDGQTDPGDARVLDTYRQQRSADQTATVRYTDSLARGFTNPSVVAKLGGGLGLLAHAVSPALRRRLVHSAMGLRYSA